MVWDQNLKLLVMLCQQETETVSSSECLAYWEPQYQKYQSQQHAITVSAWREEHDESIPNGIVKRILTITDGVTTREVEHLQMTCWKDRCAPG
jgi:protein tyrosine phosphatase